jgi:dihydrofolate reductase
MVRTFNHKAGRAQAAAPQYARHLWPGSVHAFEPRERSKAWMPMRRLKYQVAVSADGYLLEPDDGFEIYPSQDDPEQYLHSLHAYGIVLMGRCAYEAAQQAGHDDPYPHLMSYVFSRTQDAFAHPRVEMVRESAESWVRRIKACPGKDICLAGGARLAASLFKAGLIDEVVLKLYPMMRGSGQKLLSDLDEPIALGWQHSTACEDGTVVLSYGVLTEDPLSTEEEKRTA